MTTTRASENKSSIRRVETDAHIAKIKNVIKDNLQQKYTGNLTISINIKCGGIVTVHETVSRGL